MSKKGYCKNNKVSYFFGDCSNCVPVEQSLADSFYKEEHNEKDGSVSFSFHDPIRMLFNQERLKQLGPAAAQKWIESLKQAKSSAISQLRQHCDDNQLMDLIKSRHIQSMSELQAYAQYCTENLEEFKSSVQKLVAEQQALQAQQAVEKNMNVEPKPE